MATSVDISNFECDFDQAHAGGFRATVKVELPASVRTAAGDATAARLDQARKDFEGELAKTPEYREAERLQGVADTHRQRAEDLERLAAQLSQAIDLAALAGDVASDKRANRDKVAAEAKSCRDAQAVAESALEVARTKLDRARQQLAAAVRTRLHDDYQKRRAETLATIGFAIAPRLAELYADEAAITAVLANVGQP
jgi:hypothetical protein